MTSKPLLTIAFVGGLLHAPPVNFFKKVDELYQEVGAWRSVEPFSIALFGIPK